MSGASSGVVDEEDSRQRRCGRTDGYEELIACRPVTSYSKGSLRNLAGSMKSMTPGLLLDAARVLELIASGLRVETGEIGDAALVLRFAAFGSLEEGWREELENAVGVLENIAACADRSIPSESRMRAEEVAGEIRKRVAQIQEDGEIEESSSNPTERKAH